LIPAYLCKTCKELSRRMMKYEETYLNHELVVKSIETLLKMILEILKIKKNKDQNKKLAI
jgi:hypothetical protein